MFSVCYICVALKKDLRDDTNTIDDLKEQGEEPVSTADGEKLARDTGAVAFHECSALKRDGVHDVFHAAVRAAIIKKKVDSGCCCVIL